jgi:hypothetical protein
MNKALSKMRDEARALARHLDRPSFYVNHAREVDFSRKHFFSQPLLARLREDVIPFLYDDYGHGVAHAKHVAIDAGAIVMAELGSRDKDRARRLALLAQMAGVLHDICRLEPDHAARSAELARIILANYPLPAEDVDLVARAVAAHEAFSPQDTGDDPELELVAGALYDADKFRWGPDNFSTTLWEICDYEEWPIEEVMARFPQGMEFIRRVAGTFRTQVGRAFGPEIIETGLVLGRRIYKRLEKMSDTASGDAKGRRQT